MKPYNICIHLILKSAGSFVQTDQNILSSALKDFPEFMRSIFGHGKIDLTLRMYSLV